MRRLWQVFSGPDELEDLPDDGYSSPWTYPAQVRIPMEHWQAIIAYARRRDIDEAELLERVSVLDGERLDAQTLTQFLALLETLAIAVVDAPPLTPENADPALVPEPMPNTAHAGMVRDVSRLIQRTSRLGVMVDSWVD